MRIAIIGAGAIGCVTGALLWDKGYDVVLVGRAGQSEAINARGLIIDGVLGGKRFDVPASTSLDFEPRMVILAVKTQDIPCACREIKPFVKDSVVVTMQNGVKGDELAAESLGSDKIISAVVMYGATYIEPGRVTYNFEAPLIIGKAFPSWDDGDGVVEEAHGVLSSAFDVHVGRDIHGTHWTKLLLNLNNALAGIIGISLQEAFDDPRLCILGIMLMKEAYGAMEAGGINLTDLPDLPAERLKGLLYAPVEVGSGIYGGIMRGLCKDPLPGSVLQSIRRGRATEVDYLNGEIAVLGLRHRHPTPLNYKVTTLVKLVAESGEFMTRQELLNSVGELM